MFSAFSPVWASSGVNLGPSRLACRLAGWLASAASLVGPQGEHSQEPLPRSVPQMARRQTFMDCSGESLLPYGIHWCSGGYHLITWKSRWFLLGCSWTSQETLRCPKGSIDFLKDFKRCSDHWFAPIHFETMRGHNEFIDSLRGIPGCVWPPWGVCWIYSRMNLFSSGNLCFTQGVTFHSVRNVWFSCRNLLHSSRSWNVLISFGEHWLPYASHVFP